LDILLIPNPLVGKLGARFPEEPMNNKPTAKTIWLEPTNADRQVGEIS